MLLLLQRLPQQLQRPRAYRKTAAANCGWAPDAGPKSLPSKEAAGEAIQDSGEHSCSSSVCKVVWFGMATQCAKLLATGSMTSAAHQLLESLPQVYRFLAVSDAAEALLQLCHHAIYGLVGSAKVCLLVHKCLQLS